MTLAIAPSSNTTAAAAAAPSSNTTAAAAAAPSSNTTAAAAAPSSNTTIQMLANQSLLKYNLFHYTNKIIFLLNYIFILTNEKLTHK